MTANNQSDSERGCGRDPFRNVSVHTVDAKPAYPNSFILRSVFKLHFRCSKTSVKHAFKNVRSSMDVASVCGFPALPATAMSTTAMYHPSVESFASQLSESSTPLSYYLLLKVLQQF